MARHLQLVRAMPGANRHRGSRDPESPSRALRASHPMKIAALDIGSNSIHMVTAKVWDGGFEIIDRAKEMVGLGRSTLIKGRFSLEALEAGFKTLATFKRLAENQGCDPILAVATSAVREASNGGELVLRAWEELGLRIDVITGLREAELIFAGAAHAIDFRGQRPLVIDIGGGSVEIVLGRGNQIQWRESLKLGVARLAERFLESDPPKSSEISALRDHARTILAPAMARARRAKPTLVVGTSGTMLSLTTMCIAHRTGKIPSSLHNQIMRLKDLSEVRARLLEEPTEERAHIPGLDRKRIDLAPAGALIAELMMDSLKVRELRACEWALREGIILSYIKEHAEEIEAAGKIPDIRRRSIIQMARRFQNDESRSHSERVARLALRIFDGARSVHEMGEHERELLEYAALVHDVGLFVSHSKHHRHSYYLILNGELRGFLPEETLTIASIARYHKGALPKNSSDELSELPASMREIVIGLAAILRIADALDRSHHGIVNDVRVSRNNGRVDFKLVTNGRDAELELWAAQRKAELWEKQFGSEINFTLDKR